MEKNLFLGLNVLPAFVIPLECLKEDLSLLTGLKELHYTTNQNSC